MKVLNVELPKEVKDVVLCPLADLHIGDASCDMNFIKKEIEFIRTHKNAYCVLNGDIMNNTTRNSVGDVYHEALTPQEQIELAVKLFTPIKDKIIAITSGNHEDRTNRESGQEIMKCVALILGIDQFYSNEGACLFLKFGCKKNDITKAKGYTPLQYSLYMTHGCGGGRRAGSKATRLEDMAGLIDADIYIHSHTHLPLVMKQAFYRTDLTKGTITMVDKLFVNTGSTLDYAKYAEKFECKPSSKCMPKIHLFATGDTKQMEVVM